MSPRLVSTSLVIVATFALLSACQNRDLADGTQSEPAAASARAEPPPAATPAPSPRNNDNATTYRCDDGTQVSIAYGKHQASVRLADARQLTLPRAESASKGGGDVYVGETLSLLREGERVQLHEGEAPARSCTAIGSQP